VSKHRKPVAANHIAGERMIVVCDDGAVFYYGACQVNGEDAFRWLPFEPIPGTLEAERQPQEGDTDDRDEHGPR
jgi:hypothetical protein